MVSIRANDLRSETKSRTQNYPVKFILLIKQSYDLNVLEYQCSLLVWWKRCK